APPVPEPATPPAPALAPAAPPALPAVVAAIVPAAPDVVLAPMAPAAPPPDPVVVVFPPEVLVAVAGVPGWDVESPPVQARPTTAAVVARSVRFFIRTSPGPNDGRAYVNPFTSSASLRRRWDFQKVPRRRVVPFVG